MALTPEQLEKLSDPVVEIYNAIEEELLLNMARTIKEGKELLLAAEDGTAYQHWRLVQLRKLGNLNQDQIAVIAKHSGKTSSEVNKMIKDAGYTALERTDEVLKKAVEESVKGAALAGSVPTMQTTMESLSVFDILQTYQNQAKSTLNLVNMTMLNHSQQMYRDVINKNVGKLLTGTITHQEVLKRTVTEWAEKGIPALTDSAGRKWTTTAYVNMVTRTTSQNVAKEMQFKRMDDYKVDLIEVSSHKDARPKCALVQGRIFDRSGKSTKYPAWSSTSYGEPDGILGINCRHVIYPFIEGTSRQTYLPYDLEETEKAYKDSQKQRAFERAIRKEKLKLKMMKEIGSKEGIAESKAKISALEGDLVNFLTKAQRTRRRYRENIVDVKKKKAN